MIKVYKELVKGNIVVIVINFVVVVVLGGDDDECCCLSLLLLSRWKSHRARGLHLILGWEASLSLTWSLSIISNINYYIYNWNIDI